MCLYMREIYGTHTTDANTLKPYSFARTISQSAPYIYITIIINYHRSLYNKSNDTMIKQEDEMNTSSVAIYVRIYMVDRIARDI